jgi:hypothetical protein
MSVVGPSGCGELTGWGSSEDILYGIIIQGKRVTQGHREKRKVVLDGEMSVPIYRLESYNETVASFVIPAMAVSTWQQAGILDLLLYW